MKLLHHNESELSRALLATIPEGCELLDCTLGVPQGYSGPSPSAFPSVVFSVPEKSETEAQYGNDGGLLGVVSMIIPAHEEIIRLPASWEAVNAYVAWASGGA